MNRALKLIVMAVVTLSVLGMSQTASAWWGHAWGGPVWGPRFAYPAYPVAYGYYGYGYDPCCAPIVEPCCAPAAPVAAACATCEPVCDTCGPAVGYYGYATNYVLGWRPGPIRRLLFGRYRWYATGYYGGYYYTPDCCEPSYDVQGAPVKDVPAPTPAPAPAEPAAPSVVNPDANSASVLTTSPFHQTSFTQKEAVPENSGIVTIYVPQDAVVYVNDALTSTTGSSRSFVSFGLTSGNEYDYVIRAEVTREGQKYVETKVVTLKAGDQSAVSFSFTKLANPTDQVVAL